MRLALVIPSLAQGGAERDIAEMANHWAAAGHAVSVVTLSDAAGDSYPLHPVVTRVALGVMHHSQSVAQSVLWNLRRFRALRQALRDARPDCIISFIDTMNVATLLATAGFRAPVIVAERVDPRRHPIGRAWTVLRRLTYPRCSALVALTESARAFCQGLAKSRPVVVIPNPARKLERRGAPRTAPGDGRGRRIVALGRLTPQKGFDLLIDAFSRVATAHLDWALEIYGEGDERAALERQIVERGLADRVRLPGWTGDPAAVLESSDIFVMSSRYEGFGNALAEAMSAGIAVISFDCDSGPGELIRNDIDGLLVPPNDVAELAGALSRLMDDRELRLRLASRAPEVLERFSAERFFAQWESLIGEVCGANRG